MRVIPRDLFNESMLLKCVGKLTLLIHDNAVQGLSFEHDGGAFEINQDESDGSISIANVQFSNAHGSRVRVFHPLNARGNWVLMATSGDEECSVFDDAGCLSGEFISLIGKEAA